MRVLFIFPHPDDESFGPAGAIHQLAREGHEVHLLTLTKGGATKVRHRLGLSVEEMGRLREKELRNVQPILRLAGLTVWDMIDSGMAEMDPREIESMIGGFIRKLQPAVLVTYPVQGISGFADHLVCHAVVKRVYLDLKQHGADYLKRLVFFAIDESHAPKDANGRFRLNPSRPELIDCILELNDQDYDAFHRALDCYPTYAEVIAASKVRETIGRQVHFEFFQESYSPAVNDMFVGLQ